MNASQKNFTIQDKKEIELLGRLMHNVVKMRIQQKVREKIYGNQLYDHQRNEYIDRKCSVEFKNLMYLWIGLLKFIKAEYGLPTRRKMTTLFTVNGLPLPPEMLMAAADASEIVFMDDEDVKYVFSQMAEPPRLSQVMRHLRPLLRLK